VFNFTIRQLEYLIAVAEARSITLAAEQKGVSAPSISAALLQLEARLGVPLFIRRHAQGMNLTPYGSDIVQHAKQILDRSRLLTEAANRLSGKVMGHLTVGCLSTFAQILLPKLRRIFTLKYPQVEFHQVATHQMELVEALRDARMDLALTYDLAVPTDLSFVGLAELPPFVMLPERHALSGRASLTVEELATQPLILLDLPHSSDYFLSFFEKTHVKPVIFERTKDMALVQSMVANGFGYSFANVRPRTCDSPDGSPLVFIPLAGAVKPMRMGLLFPSGAHDLPTIRAFMDMCRDSVPQEVETSLTVRPATSGLDNS
jgi:DNA-binding transcriptional LysR family regulator